MSEPGKRGQPGKYSPLFAAVAREYYKHGYTHRQVGKLFGAAGSSVSRWIREHEEFRKAYYEGRTAAAEFRLSQIPPPPPLFPRPAQPRPTAAGHGEPITKVERIFVEPPVRNR